MRVARSAAELDELRGAWGALELEHPEAELDVVLAVAGSRPDVVRPHVVVLEDDGRPEAMLVARLETSHLPARFGYATVYRPLLRTLVVVSGGLAGPASAARPLLAAALEALAAKEADALVLNRVAVGSPLFEAAVDMAPTGSLQRPLVTSPHWVVDIPDVYADFLRAMPKKLRDDLKRYGPRLERELPGRVKLERYDRPEQLGALLESLEAIASVTYQRGLGAGFDVASDAALIELGLARRTCRAWVLTIDGSPCAFEIGTVHGDRFIVGAKGYDPDHASRHVGKALQMMVLADLCEDPRIRVVDFGFGDADYKRRLASRSWEEADVLIYGRTRRALAANAGRSSILAADRLARRVAGPQWTAGVKRRWRALRTPVTA